MPSVSLLRPVEQKMPTGIKTSDNISKKRSSSEREKTPNKKSLYVNSAAAHKMAPTKPQSCPGAMALRFPSQIHLSVCP